MNKHEIMTTAEVNKLLEPVTVAISQIERSCGIPKNTLQKAAKGERTLPKRWAIKLQFYVDKKHYIADEVKYQKKLKSAGTAKQETGKETGGEGNGNDENATPKQENVTTPEPFVNDAIRKKRGW